MLGFFFLQYEFERQCSGYDNLVTLLYSDAAVGFAWRGVGTGAERRQVGGMEG